MSQNPSSAVMQQRSEPHDSLDFFPTPAWATRALCEHVIRIPKGYNALAWEPACGEGHMAKPLAEYFQRVFPSDVHDYGFGEKIDFLFNSDRSAEWVITNPPFRLAAQFIETASYKAKEGFAMLVRIAFLEGVGRYKELFSKNPPSIIAQFSERVPMFKGRVDAKGSTATAYCWLVWSPRRVAKNTEFLWIPPCRKQLEREGDYA